MSEARNLNKLLQGVLGKQKVLAEIYEQHKSVTLFDYVNSWPASNMELDKHFLKITQNLLGQIYSAEIAAAITIQLARNPLVSTIDHHGIWGHPFFLNSNLIYSLKERQNFLVCFTTAGVSLNNSSYPASLILNNSETSQPQHYNFFPGRMQVVLFTQSLRQANVTKPLSGISN